MLNVFMKEEEEKKKSSCVISLSVWLRQPPIIIEL